MYIPPLALYIVGWLAGIGLAPKVPLFAEGYPMSQEIPCDSTDVLESCCSNNNQRPSLLRRGVVA